jgi:hypothetical protein
MYLLSSLNTAGASEKLVGDYYILQYAPDSVEKSNITAKNDLLVI